MRTSYHEALDAVTDELVTMSRMVGSMLNRASTALLEADREKAEAVIAADEAIDQMNAEIELRTTELIALQQPVATDLRMVVAAMRISATLERMGDLAQHIAKSARMRYPDRAVPDRALDHFRQMAHLADEMVAKMGDVIAGKDVKLAMELDHQDDEMDRLHREVLEQMLDDGSEYGIGEAVDLTLLNRYYERIGDHSVSVARRVVYLVIGERASDTQPV